MDSDWWNCHKFWEQEPLVSKDSLTMNAILATLCLFTLSTLVYSEFTAVIKDLDNGKLDLGDDSDFQTLMKAGAEKYPKSDLFTVNMNQETFIKNTVEKTIKESYTQGLYMAQMICSYVSFGTVIMNRTIDLDASHLETGALETVVTIANRVGLNVKNLPFRLRYFETGEDLSTIYNKFETCALKSDWFDFKCTVQFLGDATISNEIDEENDNLEGNTHTNATCFLINALQEVARTPEFVPYLDVSLISVIIDTLRRTGATNRFMTSLHQSPVKYEKIESFFLSSLSAMKVGDEFLLPAGFRSHATSILITKKSAIFYDIYAFNSGDGLDHHQTVLRDGQRKYFAAKRYLGLTLFALFRSHFFRKYAEIVGIAHLSFTSPEGESVTATGPVFYSYVLSALDDFAVPYTDEDLKTVPVITIQRSGTCAFRSLLAYVLWKIEKPDGTKIIKSNKEFRLLKLMLYSVVIHMATEKTWMQKEYTLKRVLKFGMQNYARSLLKYEQERSDPDPCVDIFNIPDFAEKYKKLTAKVTVEDLSKSNIDYTAEMHKFEGNDSLSWKDLYAASDFELLRQQITTDNIVNQVHLLIDILNGKWISVNRSHALAFVLSVVINEWPDPGDALYTSIPQADIDTISEALYGLFVDVNTVAFSMDRIHWPTFAFYVKVLGIVTDMFSILHPDVKRCKIAEQDMPSDVYSYLMSDQRQIKIINDFYNSGDMKCFRNIGNQVIEGGPLEKYFTNSNIDSDIGILTAFCMPMKYGLPKVVHYWRLMAKIVKYSEEHIDFLLKFKIVPRDDSDDCRIEMIDCKPHAKCTSDEFTFEGNFEQLRMEMDYEYKILWPHRVSCISAKVDFCSLPAETPLIDHTLFGNTDYIGRYYRVLSESSAQMSWSAVVHLGLRILAIETNPNMEILKALTEFLNSSIAASLVELRSEDLSEIGELRQDIVSKVRRAAGFIIILGYSLELLGGDKASLISRRNQYYDFLTSMPIHPKLYSYLALGYILSIQNSEMTDDEAKVILVLSNRLNGMSSGFSSIVEKEYYYFQSLMVASAAIRKLSNAQKGLVDEIISILFKNQQIKEIAYPNIMIDDGTIVDLLTGIVFKNGLLMSPAAFDDLKPYVNQCKLKDLGPQSFKSISVASTNHGPIFTCTLVEPDKLRFINGTVYSRTQLQLLKGMVTIVIRETFLDPRSLEEIHSISTPVDLTDYPVPFTTDLEVEYRVRLFKDNVMQLFFGNEVIWKQGDKYSFPNYDLDDLTFSGPSIYERVLPLSNKVLCFEKDGQLHLLLKNYCDEKGMFIWLNTVPRLCLRSNPKLYVPPNQSLDRDYKYTNYLLLKDSESGDEKIMLPVEHYKLLFTSIGEELAAKQTLSDFPTFKYLVKFSNYLKKTLLIDVSNQSVNPKSRFEVILLAYNALTTRRYRKSFNYVKRIHQMNPFTPAELKIIGWILYSNISNGDGSPESVAVQAYAIFKLLENHFLFGDSDSKKSSTKSTTDYTNKKQISGNETDDWWVGFWSDLYREKIGEVTQAYRRVVSKIPVYLRFDAEAPRPLISAFQQQFWLNGTLSGVTKNVVAFGPDAKDDKINFLPLVQPMHLRQFSDQSTQTDLLKDVSYLRPNGLTEKQRDWLLYFIFKKDWQEDEREKMEIFLDTFEHSGAVGFVNNLRTLLDSYKRKEVAKDIRTACANSDAAMKGICSDAWTMAISKLGLSTGSTKQNAINVASVADDSEKVVKSRHLLNFKLFTPRFDDDPQLNLFDIKDDLRIQMPLHRLDDPDHRKTLIDQYQSKLKQFEAIADKEFETIMERLYDLRSALYYTSSFDEQLVPIARGSFKISKQDILYLYGHANIGKYIEIIPELAQDDLDMLMSILEPIHRQITEYVLTLTNCNDLKRLIKALNKYATDRTILETEVNERVRTTQTDQNAMMAYEYFMNSRLTEQQAKDLTVMTKHNDKQRYPHKVIQRMMSAGKTFVYGTVLAFMKADRSNLSVLVVPRSLYTSEASSIISRTMQAFSGDGFSFNITRDNSPKAIQSLEWIDDAIKTAKEKGKYLILPPEILLTLQNKYIEAALNKNNKVLSLLQSISSELKESGAATFDEIHITFNPNQELNFPLKDTSVNLTTVDLKKEGYMLCEVFKVFMTKEVQDKANILQNVVPTTDSIEKACSLAADILIQQLLNPKTFTLLSISPTEVEGLQKLKPKALKVFLTGKSDEIDLSDITIVSSAVSPEIFRLLAICRLMLTDWMRVAWSSNIMENYGLDSKNLYVVPYYSAGAPKEGSEYSFRWYTYVRTIRFYLVSGMNPMVFQESLAHFKALALKASAENEIPNSSVPEILFISLFERRILGVDLTDNSVLSELYQDQLSKKRSAEYLNYLFEFISDKVIPSVKYYAKQISSCAQDFTIMFNSIQGYSGTISSTVQLPRYFLRSKNTDLDPEITETIKTKIIKENNFTPLVIDLAKDPKTIFELMLKHTSLSELEAQNTNIKRSFNAIIDVGAYFKDFSNEQVAEALKEKIDTVFYYSTEVKTKNQLTLLHEKRAPKVIESVSKASLEALGLDSKKRITYYDQSHCTGSDIFQDDFGYGLVLIGAKTSSGDFYQAVMRMRRFLHDQRVILAVPKEVVKIVKQVTGNDQITVENLVKFMEINEKNKLVQGNSTSLRRTLP